mmetsp:Transcript_12215/g.29930  ORF Transcript_12215/g.29930 Transcript_12215/m.29930 type:complete len:269 (+) Transcript_12215:1-807(+)
MKPPVIDTADKLREKYDMCDVLMDIETAQEMAEQEQEEVKPQKAVPHPFDAKYKSLDAKVELLPVESEEFKVIQTFFQATKAGHYRNLSLVDVYRVERSGECQRFHQNHGKLSNRRLLWHGTNVAVVAAILKSGLRIMPHSGGRVGRGIYLADENSKSACYVRPSRRKGNLGVMFLAEAALGKEHHIAKDDPSLKQAPPPFDCVVAKGRQEPPTTMDATLKLDGNTVSVSQAAPTKNSKFASSSFSQNEFLVYQESQACIRYLLTIRF